MLKTLLDINTRRLHAEQVRFNYEERVGCQILDLLGKIVPKEDKENE